MLIIGSARCSGHICWVFCFRQEVDVPSTAHDITTDCTLSEIQWKRTSSWPAVVERRPCRKMDGVCAEEPRLVVAVGPRDGGGGGVPLLLDEDGVQARAEGRHGERLCLPIPLPPQLGVGPRAGHRAPKKHLPRARNPEVTSVDILPLGGGREKV